MATFDQEVAVLRARRGERKAIPAARTVVLQPLDFSPTWAERPSSAVCFGIRIPCEADTDGLKAEAEKRAIEKHPGDPMAAMYERDRLLVRWVVARAICDPNDCGSPHPLFQFADEQVPEALTKGAILRIHDDLERLIVETSPNYHEATDEQCVELGAALVDGSILAELAKTSPVKAARVRRYLRFVYDEIVPDE